MVGALCLLENVRGGKGHRNSEIQIDSSLWRERRRECCVLQFCIYKFMCSAFSPFRLPFPITPISFISRSLRVLQALTLISVLGSFTYLSRLYSVLPNHVCLRYIPFRKHTRLVSRVVTERFQRGSTEFSVIHQVSLLAIQLLSMS